MTDDTAAIQAAVDSGAENIYLPPGIYNYSSLITISTKTRLYGPATLNETVLLDEGILINAVDNVILEQLTFTGVETLIAWNAGDAAYRQSQKYFVRFYSSKNSTFRDIASSGKRGAVRFDSCQKCLANNIRHDGFLGDISTPVSDANYYAVINIYGGREHHISSCEGYSVGSVLLIQNEASYNTVTQITGREVHDNMVYNSSGNYSAFSNSTCENVSGAGLKIRGSAHAITNNSLVSCNLGISITGNGVTPDSFGANGFGAGS